eukprot:TRINITY_DN1627_c0_g3_i1.p1 TRINITY_DN1627_c0_g3~~TRINITY_DN1627_c0_g3_i1.p1  ORF type:complete len:164 (+),score=43.99 TRINITY_DN1627_c0_g3_i1:66-557(+)
MALLGDVDMMDVDDAAVQHSMLQALAQQEPQAPPSQQQLAQWSEETDYSEKYCDDLFEYRRVTVPRGMLHLLPSGRTMSEQEWRQHGITMSRGWEHYDHHHPEANVLLFRRVLGTDPKSGRIPPEMATKVQQRACYIAELEQARQRMIQEQARKQEQQMADMF